MTDEQIHGNEVIVHFVSDSPQCKKAEKYFKNEICGGVPDYTGLKYHSSWDWLMSVVKKIQMHSPEAPKESSGWYAYYGMTTWLECVDIQRVFEHCVQYIEWYNKNY